MAILRVEDLTRQFPVSEITTSGKIVLYSYDPKVSIPKLYFQKDEDFRQFDSIAGPFFGIGDVLYSLTTSTHGNAYTYYGQPAELVKLPDNIEPDTLQQTRQFRLYYEILAVSVFEELYNRIAHSK